MSSWTAVMRRSVSIAMICVLGGGFPAAAQSTPEACASLDDGDGRLSCYDAIFRASEKPAPKSPTHWVVREEVSRVDDSRTVFVSTWARGPYYDEYGTRRMPGLILRCLENTTSMYVDFNGDYMADSRYYGPVVLRVDGRPAEKHDMQASTDHHALGLWRGSRSIPVIKGMLGASSLLMRVTPVNSSAVEIEFDITGLDEAVTSLRRACSW